MARQDLRGQAQRRSPEELVRQLQSFNLNLKFSAGIWCFSPPQSRFRDRYQPQLDVRARLDLAARLKDYGLGALEAHYPNEISEENAEIWQQFTHDTGIRLISIIPLLFWNRTFEWGSLSNPIADVRREAIELTKRAFQMNRAFDTDMAVVWPGIDGYENPFGIDFPALRRRFAEGLAEAMDAAPGIRVAFEPKPYEPRGHIIYGTTPEGMLLCHQVEAMLAQEDNRRILGEGHALCCLNPEIGHALMAYEDLPYAYSWPLSEGRLAHLHLNSQPLGNYDQDLNIGMVAPEQFEALLYVLKMHGYQGWFGIDINPERMPVETAVRICIDAVRAANDRINGMDHESVVYAANNPDKSRGWLESYLIRARASRPENLPTLAKPWE
jgi:xylose isomerase